MPTYSPNAQHETRHIYLMGNSERASCVLEGFYLLTSGDSVEQRYYLTGKDQYEL